MGVAIEIVGEEAEEAVVPVEGEREVEDPVVVEIVFVVVGVAGGPRVRAGRSLFEAEVEAEQYQVEAEESEVEMAGGVDEEEGMDAM